MIDPQEVPRYAGIATFMRLPHVPQLADVDADAAFLGVPVDGGSTYRSGARMGPGAIREASRIVKPYNQHLDVDLREYTIVDHGDTGVTPGYLEDTLDQVEDHVDTVLRHGAVPLLAGGGHSISLPAVRAVADRHGPLSLVQFDAHSDLWPEYFGKEYTHGTWVHHAVQEGVVDPETSIRIGDRGSLYGPEDVERHDTSGIEYYTSDELQRRGVSAVAGRIHERVEGPTYVTIDIDSADPAFAPGTTTPAPGGLTARELLALTRSLHGLDVRGLDLVETNPSYDNDSGITSILAAHLLFEATCAALG